MENIERKIISNPSITDVQVLSSFVKSKNREAKNIDEIACCFIEVGKKYGVNGNIAFCQAILETGWFKFDKGTAVTPEQHNYCGLGVVSKGSKGCSFNTVEDGVTAMIQHLYAYADTKELPKGEILIDPRFKYVQRGVAKTWDDLSNRWAMNKDYGKHILNIYEELINYKPEGGITVSKLIALSDGHGVDTAGKRTPVLPNGEKSETGKAYMNENLFNRAVVKYLDAELKRHGFKTLLVAPTDADTPLETRTKLANSKKADLYVSVHANASAGKWGSHGGIETFTWGSGESLRIGKLIHAELIKGSPLKDRGVKNGQHLWEVKQTNMPAVLVEAGFMDSHNDYKYLLSDTYRKECAIEIAKGICKAYGITYKEENTETVKKVLGETIVKVEKDMKLELMDAQWKQLATIFREAVTDGVLEDEKWEKKAQDKTLTLSELSYLSLLLDHRRFRDYVKNKK